jgi:hypothetical protein
LDPHTSPQEATASSKNLSFEAPTLTFYLQCVHGVRLKGNSMNVWISCQIRACNTKFWEVYEPPSKESTTRYRYGGCLSLTIVLYFWRWWRNKSV